MPNSTQIICVLVVFGLLWLAAFLFIRDRNKTIKLRMEYEPALKSGDKQRALEAGRNYYRQLRARRLTIYDEQAIANDLSAMK